MEQTVTPDRAPHLAIGGVFRKLNNVLYIRDTLRFVFNFLTIKKPDMANLVQISSLHFLVYINLHPEYIRTCLKILRM